MTCCFYLFIWSGAVVSWTMMSESDMDRESCAKLSSKSSSSSLLAPIIQPDRLRDAHVSVWPRLRVAPVSCVTVDWYPTAAPTQWLVILPVTNHSTCPIRPLTGPHAWCHAGSVRVHRCVRPDWCPTRPPPAAGYRPFRRWLTRSMI
jgi:hypothetical protein